ncbi:hypothetical protein CHARACLAT_030477, partial [Characodon lateralis]|nr:hypothetical protein [Characodon lateralis]
VSVFIDSGADTEFMDEAFAKSLGIELFPTPDTHNILALDGHHLSSSHLRTDKIAVPY